MSAKLTILTREDQRCGESPEKNSMNKILCVVQYCVDETKNLRNILCSTLLLNEARLEWAFFGSLTLLHACRRPLAPLGKGEPCSWGKACPWGLIWGAHFDQTPKLHQMSQKSGSS